jgi:glycosyltransferase involved in cell wall biosynthesis
VAKVAVVIPCYNLGKYLSEAVESVLDQTHQDFEIAVVDDGSDDEKTVDILSRLRFPKTRVIRTANCGPAAARNVGIKSTSSQYVVCLDADDWLDKTYLETTSRVLDADFDGKIGIVSTWMDWFGKFSGVIRLGPYATHGFAFHDFAHVASMFRRKCWEEVGGYYDRDILFFEDWFLWICILEKGYRCVTVPEPLFHYRVRDISRITLLEANRTYLYSRLIAAKPRFFVRNLLAGSLDVLNRRLKMSLGTYRKLDSEQMDANSKGSQYLVSAEDVKRLLFAMGRTLLKGSQSHTVHVPTPTGEELKRNS